MNSIRQRNLPTLSAGSMADIAFLLLAFFFMTTEINNEKGLMMMLPAWVDDPPKSEWKERNVFNIQINGANAYLVESERRIDIVGLRGEIKKFILNFGSDKSLSDNPEVAIVSIKADRNANHETFIKTLDEVQAAYFEIYAERANLTTKNFRELDLTSASQKKIYDKAREGIPMNISVAASSANR